MNINEPRWFQNPAAAYDSTIKPKSKIQCQFHSETDSTIKPINRIQHQLNSETDSTINQQIAINVNLI